MNLAGLEQFHQYKSHDETDGRPFQASQSGIEHPAQTLAHAATALKGGLDLGATFHQLTRVRSADAQALDREL